MEKVRILKYMCENCISEWPPSWMYHVKTYYLALNDRNEVKACKYRYSASKSKCNR